MRSLIALLAAPLILSAPQANAAPPDLGWMAGEWIGCDGDEVVEEHWMGPAGGVLVGANLTRSKDGKRRSFEFLRVAPNADGGLSYLAHPGGRAPTEFRSVSLEPGKAVFENPANDFPTRILYWREGERLHARIEGRLRGKDEAMEWTWSRKATAACG